jgi:hypothetical protein
MCIPDCVHAVSQQPCCCYCCMQYLQDCDCPVSLEPGGSNMQAVLQWLLNYAVSLEYADTGEAARVPHPHMHHVFC